ncbi:Bifunctional DNA primase/polymerase, N-terminal (plasmid) [Tsukamurella tyrosinosolvens]|uniref:Bifunctional DNA primase/polymerase, N-terminal n=1 Tax=Tsukamurella tyrosinosolvens TaxID=57704 RepID=A0A1H4WIM2_TSUTY|nr:AAA family ATPase [Tsukamurella tyrosinosolvens]SEC93182.1 Bifunctional DNA primase/polymerase, N-terminal [Tsukamurella tyrosinosolvens]VEH89375.1 Bifunctional DNA primase/polymerase, N-terminal [Tsukamurella tyrosinosolvens]
MTVAHTVNRLLELDFHLLPLRPDSKAPFEAGWPDAPRMTAEAATEWVARGGGLGVNLGASRLVVLDAEDAAATDYLVKLGFAPTVATANSQDRQSEKFGGRHVYLRVPTGIDRELHTAPGFPVGDGGTLEVLAGRRFAVLPPTNLNSRSYAPIAGSPLDPGGAPMIQDAPDWLLEASVPAPAGAGPMVGKLAERPARETAGDSDEFDVVVDSIPWDAVVDGDARLSPSGADACGCPTYSWAGSANARSAVLHDCASVGSAAAVWSSTMKADLGLDTDHCSRLRLAAALRGHSIRESMDELAEQIGVEWPKRWSEPEPMILPDGVVPAGGVRVESTPNRAPLAAAVGGVDVPAAAARPALASVTPLPAIFTTQPTPSAALDLLASIRSAEWLDQQTFAPLVELVPGVVTEGCGLIVGPPKAGKSWFVLAVALAVAAGGRALGCLSCEKRPVFYLALEDGDRRLQTRMRQLHGKAPLPSGFDYMTAIQPGMAAATISAWLDRHRDAQPLIIVDTLGKTRGTGPGPGASAYQHDYHAMSELKALVDGLPGSSMLIVHHTRKSGSGTGGDFVDAVSGTHGLAGAADFVLVLSRKRGTSAGQLSITGRDVTEREVALTTADGLWTLDGGSLDAAQRALSTREASGQLGGRSLGILDIVNSSDGAITPGEVAAQTGLDAKSVSNVLNAAVAAGRLEKVARGQYRRLERT